MLSAKQSGHIAAVWIGTMLLASCGGGGAGSEATAPPVELRLVVELTPGGTQIICSSARPVQARLTSWSGGTSVQSIISCPSTKMLAGDYVLAEWEAVPLPLSPTNGIAVGAVRALSVLPAPVVVRHGEQVLVLPDATINALSNPSSVERLGPSGEAEMSAPSSDRVAAYARSGSLEQWRRSAVVNNVTYRSEPAMLRSFTMRELGVWGAMALGDAPAAGGARLFASNDQPGIPAGLLMQDREFRDLRYADLDNDGRTDFVSNVYGRGCVLIAFAQPGGGYEVTTPLDSDGLCIGGHGETILVADFDGDGRVDIFLPTYERFYLLRNQGGRRFVEVAEKAGIAFPQYTPRVEGAAALDIDLDGDVDIVAVSEVLLNDGRGHFRPMTSPFGPVRIFDEGLSVADVDMDGRWDIVKHDPELGPRVFWGNSHGGFDDTGWIFGGASVSLAANGVAVGQLTGNRLPELLLAGGLPVPSLPGQTIHLSGQGPRMCLQAKPREFHCISSFLAAVDNSWSDLLMVTDIDGDGSNELVARYGTLKTYDVPPMPGQNVFRFDLRDAAGHRTLFGRTLTAKCQVDGTLVGMKFVDGGNGFMAQQDYVVNFASSWCRAVVLEAVTSSGVQQLGSFKPGTYLLNMTFASR